MENQVLKGLAALMVFIGLNSTQIAAQENYTNHLSGQYFGFETGGAGWWMQHPVNWGITNEKAANGNYSIKFISDIVPSESLKAHGGNSDLEGSQVSLDTGKYTMTLKVWIDSAADISGFETTIKTPWKNILWNFDGIARNKWVELSQEIFLTEAVIESNLLLVVSSTNGGTGIFYVDDISIWGETIIEKPEVPYITHVETVDGAGLNQAAGTYKIKLKVWVEPDATISKFYTLIDDPWQLVKWDLNNIAKGEWVALEQELTLDTDVINSGFKIQLSNNPEYGGGKGTFYIDDISFEQKIVAIQPEINEFQIKVYPNPTSDILNIEAPFDCQITILNISGVIVKHVEQSSAIHTIQVSALPAGIYFIRVTTESKSLVEKVLLE